MSNSTVALLLFLATATASNNLRARVKSVAGETTGGGSRALPPLTDHKPLTISSRDALKALTREHPLLLVFYKKNASHLAKIRAAASQFAKHNARAKVVIFDAQGMDLPDLADLGVKGFPSAELFVSGHRKPFAGRIVYDQLQIWMKEVVESAPIVRGDLSQVEHIDSHYFVYVDPDALQKDRRKFELLAQLICPLRVYTGFRLTVPGAPPQGSYEALTVRKYRRQTEIIDLSQPMDQVAARIVASEFPREVECDDDSLSIVTEFKIPALIYFEDRVRPASEQWSVARNYSAVQTAAFHKADYLVLFRVDIRDTGRCGTFLRNFLGVTAAPALRILNMVSTVKRYKFLGRFDREHIEFFLANYVTGNLKTYRLNQALNGTETLFGLPLASYSSLRRAKKDSTARHLFYVYDSSVPSPAEDVQEILRLPSLLRHPQKFKLHAIDHSRNDVDGFYNNAVPFIFLPLRNGKYLTFDGEKITAENLLKFLQDAFPEQRSKQPPNDDL